MRWCLEWKSIEGVRRWSDFDSADGFDGVDGGFDGVGGGFDGFDGDGGFDGIERDSDGLDGFGGTNGDAGFGFAGLSGRKGLGDRSKQEKTALRDVEISLWKTWICSSKKQA